MLANGAAGGPNGCQRSSNVGRATQPKPEMYDASNPARLARLALEDQHVPAARSLGLDEVVLFVDGDDAKDNLVKAQGTLRIADGKRNVREAVRLHG